MLSYLVLFVLPLAVFGVRRERESAVGIADVARDWDRFHPFGVAETGLVLRLPLPAPARLGLALLRTKRLTARL
jgi:hypothetical protein